MIPTDLLDHASHRCSTERTTILIVQNIKVPSDLTVFSCDEWSSSARPDQIAVATFFPPVVYTPQPSMSDLILRNEQLELDKGMLDSIIQAFRNKDDDIDEDDSLAVRDILEKIDTLYAEDKISEDTFADIIKAGDEMQNLLDNRASTMKLGEDHFVYIEREVAATITADWDKATEDVERN